MATNLTEAAMRPNDWVQAGTGTNATATATRAAPGAQRKHLLRDAIIILSGAPTTAGAVTLTGPVSEAGGGPSSATIATLPVGGPTVVLIPLNIVCDVNAAASVAVAALGSGIAASVTITGTTLSA
jgi:hypothetical protein